MEHAGGMKLTPASIFDALSNVLLPLYCVYDIFCWSADVQLKTLPHISIYARFDETRERKYDEKRGNRITGDVYNARAFA
jgi:hypothetical protein